MYEDEDIYDSLRPADQPELVIVEETRPRPPGNVFGEINGRINI